ncbi:MAG: hypothetical protein ACOCTG_05565, partial [Bacteroidota bacterium]
PVITGPAIMWYETRVHPGPHNWENVRRLVGVARDLRLQGSVVTAWLPQRYVPGVLPHAIAYAGLLMQDPEMADPEVSMASFVHTYFGTDDPEVARAFVRLAGIESTRSDLFATFWSDEASFSERLTPENRAQDSAYLHRVAGLGHAFKRLEERIARNHQDFQAYVLLADLLEYLGSRRTLPAAVDYALAQAQVERERGNEGMAADRLATMTAHLHALRAARLHLIDRMNEHWDHYRYPDHPLKSGGGPNSLMWWLKDDRHHAFAEQELVERLESDS